MTEPDPLGISVSRRTVAVVLVLAVIAAAAAVTVHRLGRDDGGCRAATRVPARSPLLDTAGMVEQPDERLDTLTAAVNQMDPPFGAVVAGVGYNYDQWLHLYGVPGGLLAWTKNNAPVTLLDSGTLKPRWSLRPETKRTAWDSSGGDFLLLDLSSRKPTVVGSYDLATGKQRWCTTLSSRHRAGDPVTTTRIVGGDLVTAFKAGDRARFTRLDGSSGKRRWQHDLAGTDRVDFAGPIPGHLFVAGGTEEYRLAQPDPSAPGGTVISAFHNADGSRLWSWDVDPGTLAHVVGLAYDRTVVIERSASGTELIALSPTGVPVWRTVPRDGAYEATLRDGVVLMKTAGSLDGYDVSDGKLLWRQPLPTDRTYFPYGFTLSQMPSLDAGRVLMPTTDALVVLEVRSGKQTSYPLPTDGVSTTYWPYQLVVTGNRVGVVTNTGGILADLDVDAVG